MINQDYRFLLPNPRLTLLEHIEKQAGYLLFGFGCSLWMGIGYALFWVASA